MEVDSHCVESRAKGDPSNVVSSSQSAPLPPPPRFVEEDDVNYINLEEDSEHQVPNTQEPSLSGPLNSRKQTSRAWVYFDQIYENGVLVSARCKQCKKVLSAAVKGGTSHLIKHGETTCVHRHLNLGKNSTSSSSQTTLNLVKSEDGTTKLGGLKGKEKWSFDPDVSRRKLLDMIVMHEYPLSIVDHNGFKDFVGSLNNNFKMVSRNTMKCDIMKLFETEKEALKCLLMHNSSRVAITTDMWTASNQKKGYMVITSHFIDDHWILLNRTLRFSYVPCPHTKTILAKVLMDCLTHYGIANKVSSVVVDNCTTNDAMMSMLRDEFEPKSLMLSGTFLHMRCAAHILNLVVKDGLDVIESAIEKVRDCVAFWTLTPKRVEKFLEACRFLQLDKPKMLALDCKTRWNSTFLMLETCLPYRDVFERLKRVNKKMKFVIPSEDDWEMAEKVCRKLEIFYKVTKAFSGRNYPTANLFFRRICDIRIRLNKWLDDECSVIRMMAASMIEKFDKYWKETHGLLAIACIFDPRNKMNCVEFYFQRIYDDDGEYELKKVKELLGNLLVEYEKLGVESTEKEQGGSSKQPLKCPMKRKSPGTSHGADDEDDYALAKKTLEANVDVEGELEQYLKERVEPEDVDFDVLNYWKKNKNFPTLKAIARDILAIPISTVASESAFSMGGRVISPHRARLHAKTVEALMCLQNWITQGVIANVDVQSAIPHAFGTMEDDSDGEDANKSYVIDMDIDAVTETEDTLADMYS